MKLYPTTHAVEKYKERFRPDASNRRAQSDLIRLANTNGAFTQTKPDWVKVERARKDEIRGYMMVGDDLCMVLSRDRNSSTARRDRWIVITVLAKGTISPHERSRRNRQHKNRRQRRYGRRIKG